jgi:hypothetical protein
MVYAAARHYSIAAIAIWLAACSLLIAQQPTFRPGSKIDSPQRADAAAQSPKSSSSFPAGAPRPSSALPSASAASDEQIATWIHELDAAEFFTRETAMLQLLEAGPGVLKPLKPVLEGGSLEAISRALFIVRQIGLTADIDQQDEAGGLLAELALRKEAPALARRAAAALDELTMQRSSRALAELEGLGAKVLRNQVVGGLVLDEPALWIELGEAFRGEERDLRRLKWVASVPVLILSGPQVTDSWVKQAAAMPGLEELHLFQSQISDAGLAPLAEHPTLRQVGIYYSAAGDAVLAPLIKLPLLNYVKLYGTRVTEEGLEKFKAASGVSVDHKRGAFLGVGGIEIDGACVISQVHPNSPAEKAGLLRDDVIVRFGKAGVGNFNSLMLLIAQRDVGDDVEIEVARRSNDDQGNPIVRTVSTSVKLAPWDMEPAVRNPRR